MHVIALIVHPDTNERSQQDHCCDDQDDFHEASVGLAAGGAIRESVQPVYVASTA